MPASNISVEACEVLLGTGGMLAPAIYVLDLLEHPFDVPTAAAGLTSTVVRVPVANWNDSLTPWPAPGLHDGEKDFGGRGPETLAALVDEAIPAVERAAGLAPTRRAICGYSLAGLFSLYALVTSEAFAACACLSGSVWYPGWVDYLRESPFDGFGRYAYFSLGKKERRSGAPVMRAVQDNMESCVALCRDRGCAVDYVLGPGGHLQHHTERLAAGLAALDAFLT